LGLEGISRVRMLASAPRACLNRQAGFTAARPAAKWIPESAAEQKRARDSFPLTERHPCQSARAITLHHFSALRYCRSSSFTVVRDVLLFFHAPSVGDFAAVV